MTHANLPFDGVLVVAFGGPRGKDDVRPFLANVLRGRRVAPARLEEVVGHYEHFGGVSPLFDITMEQARGLERRLAAAGIPLPVYVGMRNWHPLLPDTIRSMSADGVRRAIGLVLAPHRSYSSCTQYRENVAEARACVSSDGLPDVAVHYVSDWHTHPKFVQAWERHIRAAIERLPVRTRGGAQIVFTAHSLPASMIGAARYQQQLAESARLIATALRCGNWTLAFQSRSGRPEDPWLGPDVCDYLRHTAGSVPAVVLAPIGFVCDHIEVLYDLDHEAAEVCRSIGLPMERAETVNDDPMFLDMETEVVLDVLKRYQSGRPLEIVQASA